MAPTEMGLAIKRARELKRWTQQDLAVEIGVDRRTVDNWENGRTVPKNSLARIERALGIRLQETSVGRHPEDDAYVARADDKGPPLRDATKDELLAEIARRLAEEPS